MVVVVVVVVVLVVVVIVVVEITNTNNIKQFNIIVEGARCIRLQCQKLEPKESRRWAVKADR